MEDDPWAGAPADTPETPPTPADDPGAGVSSGTAAPAAGETPKAEEPPPPTAADLRKLLRTRIAAVLQSRSRHINASGAQERAVATSKQTNTEFRAPPKRALE